MDNTNSFFSIADVADNLGISQKTVRRNIAAGILGAVKVGSVYRVPKAAIESFINNQNKEPKPIQYDLFGEPVLPQFFSKKWTGTGGKDFVNWIPIDDLWFNIPKNSLTFVDLFCGAGGLSKGFEMSGIEGICGLDWFKEAGMTYRHNFHHPLVEGDITTQEIKDQFYNMVKEQLNGRQLTIVAGGFPCQGFSMSGNRIVDDPRNSLYKEMLDIIKRLQPLYVICENVVGLRNMLGGKVEQKILCDFEAEGYQMNVTTLSAANYYVPQKRERVIFIGNKIGATNYHPKPILNPLEYITTGEAIGDLMTHPENEAFNHVPTRHTAEMEKRLALVEEGKSLYKGYSDAWKKCPWDQASCTIKENHGGVNIHPRLPRVLTAREMARLQSFPDDFIFKGKKNKQLVQIGNAVPPLLGKAIGLAVYKSIMDKENQKKDYKKS